MPTKDQHVRKAEGNEAFARSLTHETQTKIDWTLVVFFYSAVHYVEAYLATKGQHNRSHTTRDSWMGREKLLKKIFSSYQNLKYFGYNARYEMVNFSSTQAEEAASDLDNVKAALLPLLAPPAKGK